MKKYKNFIFEELNTNEIEENYNFVADELSKFWETLEDKLDNYGIFDPPRDAESVLAFNSRARAGEKKKKPAPVTTLTTTKAVTTLTTTKAPVTTLTTTKAPVTTLTTTVIKKQDVKGTKV